jgi:HSP20 family protein
MDFRDLIPFGRDRRDVAARGGDNPFESFQREMNRLFDDFFRGTGAMPPARFGGAEGFFGGAAAPRLDVSETDDAYEVTAELPGLEEKDVEVLLDRNLLTLKGEKRAEREEKSKDYHLTERSFGTFRRSIPLPAEIDQGKVEAHFRNGVLTVRLPKAEQARSQAKRIEVRSA